MRIPPEIEGIDTHTREVKEITNCVSAENTKHNYSYHYIVEFLSRPLLRIASTPFKITSATVTDTIIKLIDS